MKNKTIQELKNKADMTKMKIAGGKEKNLKAYKNLRREIAQALTKASFEAAETEEEK